MPPFHYPRFHIFKTADGWHLWWIPANGCIRMLPTWSSHEEALAHIDYLIHKEPP